MMAGLAFWGSVALVAYTYAGYPALLTLVARLRRPRPTPDGPLPSVTVLICAHDEETVIGHKLEQLLAVDYPHDQLHIVVAVDGDDRTADVVRAYADRGVVLSHEPERGGKAAAINRGVAVATTDVVVLTDANNEVDPGAIRALGAAFADPEVGVAVGAKTIAGGPEDLARAEGAYWRYEAYILEHESRLGCAVGAAAELLAFRRQLFEPLPTDTINDDFWLSMRIVRGGFRAVYVPDARSYEATSASEADEHERRTRMVAGRYQAMARSRQLLTWRRPVVAWQVWSHKFARPLLPLAMASALGSSVLAAWHGSRLLPRRVARSAVAAQLLAYGAVAADVRLPLPKAVHKLVAVPSYLIRTNITAVRGLQRALRRGQHTHWTRVRRGEEGPSAARSDDAPAPDRGVGGRFLTTLDYFDRPDFAARGELIRNHLPRDRPIHEELLQFVQVLWALRKGEPMMLYSASGRLHPDLMALAAWSVLSRRRPPTVLTGCMWERDAGLAGRLQALIVRLADRVITRYAVQSTDEVAIFADTWGIDAAKVSIDLYYSNARDDELADRSPFPDAGPYVFAGGTSKRDFDVLLSAALALPDLRFVVATDALDGRDDLPPNIEAGWIPRADYIPAMQHAAVAVTPLRPGLSRAAGQQTYLNAMYLGVPAVVTDSAGVRDHITHGRTGLVVDATAESLIEAICWVLDPAHESEVSAMVDAAAREVRERFTRARHITCLLEILDEAIADLHEEPS